MKYAKLIESGIAYAPRALASPGKLISNPREEDYRAAGYFPVVDEPPAGAAMPAGWEEQGGTIRRIYTPRPETHIIELSKNKICALVDRLGKTAQFFAWLQSSAELFNQWQALETLPFDPAAHNPELESLLGALEITAEEAAPLIEELKP